MIRSRRIGLSHATLALFAVAILVKAAQLQLVQGRGWRAKAEHQQTAERTVPAPRGDLLDATHRVLAQSREMVRLEIAPREVREPKKLAAALATLGVDRAQIARATDTTARYLTLPNRFLAVDAAPAMQLRGVYSYSMITRGYAVSPGAQGILGHVDQDNKPVDGLELSLDSLLRGTPGQATIVRDSHGQGRESPITPGTAPVKGNSIVLTINADLQEIAEKSLADAVAHMGAEGGDIVILDPHSGEILAMASRRMDPKQASATSITEPFEPGSTAKPFMAAGLLERGRVTDADSVDTGNGVLVIPGRTNPIRDDHLIGRAPLADVLRWSSNIGIIKFSSRLTDREKYETFRDFGFGTQTALPFGAESPGVLRPPKVWSNQSTYALPMGYEISVTPLQLALGYAAIANGGELLEPALIKEIIGPDGAVKYRHERRVVRRVVSKPVADKVRHLLLDVVDEGTALKAALDNYQLAGKTGTPRATVKGHYVAGRYNPNFVGIFPGDNPQFVIVVKLTAPHSSIYAAETAAPVSKVILQTAIAARNAALDPGMLATSRQPSKIPPTFAHMDSATVVSPAESLPTRIAAMPTPRDDSANLSTVPLVITLPSKPAKASVPTLRAVPDVRDLNLRAAVRSLQSAGFRVQLSVNGAPNPPIAAATHAATVPAGGELAKTGTLVRLIYDY
jgi:cell division protein FtsI (penicillin-binding protein 3)